MWGFDLFNTVCCIEKDECFVLNRVGQDLADLMYIVDKNRPTKIMIETISRIFCDTIGTTFKVQSNGWLMKLSNYRWEKVKANPFWSDIFNGLKQFVKSCEYSSRNMLKYADGNRESKMKLYNILKENRAWNLDLKGYRMKKLLKKLLMIKK